MFPEAGGSSSFARHAFNEFVSFFAGWALMLDYILTIAISAFFVPHYLSGLFWLALEHGPGDILFGIAVVLILSRDQRPQVLHLGTTPRWPARSAQRGAQRLVQLGVAELVAEHQRLGGHHARARGDDLGHLAVSSAARRPAPAAAPGGAARCPSACEKSRLVTGSGAVALTGPVQRSSSSAARIIPTRSSRWIQEMYWRPPATGPPTPSRNGGSIFASAPPSRSSTTPVRTCTTRMPSCRRARASASQADAHLGQEVAARRARPRRAAPRRARRSSRSPRR